MWLGCRGADQSGTDGPAIALAMVSLSSNWPLIMSVMREVVGNRITDQVSTRMVQAFIVTR